MNCRPHNRADFPPMLRFWVKMIRENEQLSCSELTGIRARWERCCGDLERRRRVSGSSPAGCFARAGLRRGDGMRRITSEDPLTQPKSKPKAGILSIPPKASVTQTRPRFAPTSYQIDAADCTHHHPRH